MSSSMNDLTPEEQDQQNQAIINFLGRAYVTRDTHTASSTALDDPHAEAQAIARVRERLLSADVEQARRSDLQLLRSNIPAIEMSYTRIEIPVHKEVRKLRGFALVALVAMLAIIIASPFFFFHQAHLNMAARPSQKHTTAPASQQPGQGGNPSEHAHALVKQFHEEAQRWGSKHLYHNPFDKKNYMLNSAYLHAGLGGELDRQLTGAKSVADFNGVIEATNNALFHLRMFEADAAVKTSYDPETLYEPVHQSDIQLLKYYKLQKGTVVLVSTAQQALRVYHDGKVIKIIRVTTGKQEMPSLIGRWQIESRQTNVTFKSTLPRGTDGWYSDIPVQYALSYHTGDYFIYDGWWRSYFGPGTQFPHQDRSDSQDSMGLANVNNGSLGGIEMPSEQAQWLYEQTHIGTPIIIY